MIDIALPRTATVCMTVLLVLACLWRPVAWAQEPATPNVAPAIAGGCQDLSQKLFRSLKTTVDDKSSVAINRQLQQVMKQVSAARDFQLTLRCLMRQNAGG